MRHEGRYPISEHLFINGLLFERKLLFMCVCNDIIAVSKRVSRYGT